MINSRDEATPSASEPSEASVTVEAVSADEGLRVLVTAPHELLLDVAGARTHAGEILAAAERIAAAG